VAGKIIEKNFVPRGKEVLTRRDSLYIPTSTEERHQAVEEKRDA
jgi:hypothetical protein